MKRLIIALGLLLITSPAYGTAISIDSFVSPDDVRISRLNENFQTLVNNLNSIPGDNLQSGTVSADALSDNADPQKRWADTFANFVITGLLAPTDASLTSTTSAGRALIIDTSANEMKYVQKDATSKTYEAGKHTYVDLSSEGTFTYTEVSQGAAEPGVTANSIRLFLVSADVTSGVGTVTDKRVIGASLGSNEDFYIKGMELEIVSPDTIVTVDAGVVYWGSTRLEKTAQTGIRPLTAADWWDGTADVFAAAGWSYVGIDSAGSIKFLGGVPDKADTDENTAGILRYWDDGSKLWRVLGAVPMSATNAIASTMYQTGNIVMYDAPFNITTAASDSSWSAGVDVSTALPKEIVRLGIFGLMVYDGDSTDSIMIAIKPSGGKWPTPVEGTPSTNAENAIGVVTGSSATGGISGQRWCAITSDAQVSHIENATSEVSTAKIDCEGFITRHR